MAATTSIARATQKHSKESPRTLLAVVDVGGNSISLEVRDARNPMQVDRSLPKKFKSFCGLAQSIGPCGSIGQKAMDCAIQTLHVIEAKIKNLEDRGHTVITRAVGTAPFRDAINGEDFAEHIRQETNIDLKIIKGKKEARYAAKGVLAYFPGISGIVADTGGGSTELALIEEGKVTKVTSLPLGMLRIKSAADPHAFIQEHLDDLPKAFSGHSTLILTGGTNRNISKSFARAYDLDISRAGMECHVPAESLSYYLAQLSEAEPGSLTTEFGIKKERAGLIKPAHILLEALRNRLDIRDMVLTKATMRDGIRMNMLKKDLPKAELAMLIAQHSAIPHLIQPEAA